MKKIYIVGQLYQIPKSHFVLYIIKIYVVLESKNSELVFTYKISFEPGGDGAHLESKHSEGRHRQRQADL